MVVDDVLRGGMVFKHSNFAHAITVEAKVINTNSVDMKYPIRRNSVKIKHPTSKQR